MGLPRFGVQQISYEALKNFHVGWAYFGRGWIVGLLRSTIGLLTDLLSAMTLYLGRSRASVEYSSRVGGLCPCADCVGRLHCNSHDQVQDCEGRYGSCVGPCNLGNH